MRNIPAESDELMKSSTGLEETDPEPVEDVNLSHFLKAFFDQVPTILYIKDEAGRYVKINPHCEMAFQVTDSQARGTTDHDHFPTEFADVFRRNDRFVLEAGGFHTFEESAVVDGEEHTFLARKFRVSDDRNGKHYVCGISTDITALKRTEQELAAAKFEAERASRAKSQFLAAISHDMRQPIQAASLFLGVLDGRIGDPKAREVLDRVKTSIDSVHGMLGDLLDLSRLDAALIKPTLKPLPLGPMLQRLHTEFCPQAELKGLTLRTVPGSATIATDPELLDRILRNLLANAVSYTASGGILLGCRRCGDSVRIVVADTGPGIPESQQHQIFEEFYQVGNAERDRSRGFGLGLAIVRRIADMLEHPVAVRSTVGKGSVFSVTVPLAAPEQRHAGDHAGSSPSCRSGHPKCRPVLLVEDDPAVLGAMVMLLEEWGLSVVTASSLEELESHIRNSAQSASLIIADYRLPGHTTGTDAVALARSMISPDLPGIILTGDTDPARLREAHANHTRLLHKPIQALQLQQVIAEILDGAAEETLPRNQDAART
jgi:two-component system, sensor histidine kinase